MPRIPDFPKRAKRLTHEADRSAIRGVIASLSGRSCLTCFTVPSQAELSRHMWSCPVTGGAVPSQVELSCHRWSCLVTGGAVPSQVELSCYLCSCPVTRHRSAALLLQMMNSCHTPPDTTQNICMSLHHVPSSPTLGIGPSHDERNCPSITFSPMAG